MLTELRKATGTGHEGHEPPERWMQPIEAKLARLGARILRDALADIARLLDPDGFYKALGANPGLTAAQIADLKLLLRQHYTCHLAPDYRNAFWRIPEETIFRWRMAGVVGPTGAWALRDPIDDAALAARLAAILDTGTSYETMRRLAAERPLGRAQEIAREFARERLWVTIDGLAWRHADIAARLAIEARQRAVNESIAAYHAGTFLRDSFPVRGNKALASALRARMKGADIERDWLRVAVTETSLTYGYGALVDYQERGVRRVYYRVHPDACADCKRLYLLPNGDPRIFTIEELLDEVARHGGTNIGRPRDEWLPTIVLHPFDRCRIVPLEENQDLRTGPPGR